MQRDLHVDIIVHASGMLAMSSRSAHFRSRTPGFRAVVCACAVCYRCSGSLIFGSCMTFAWLCDSKIHLNFEIRYASRSKLICLYLRVFVSCTHE